MTASAMATVDELSSGRAILGIGAGRSSVRLIGLHEAPLAVLRSSVDMIRSLLEGNSVSFGGTEFKLGIAARPRSVPIYLSGTGPRMLQLAAELGDGAVFVVGATRELADYAQEQLDAGVRRRAPGRPPLYRLHYVQCSVGRTKAAARPDTPEPRR